MRTFKEFLSEKKVLLEKLITFGGQAYPKFGQILILAGGAGSGKGFVLDKLVGIEGNVLDVDALKALAIGSTKFSQRVKSELGVDIKELKLDNPENVSTIREILADIYGITKRNEQRVFSSVITAHPDRKPNLIFDVTLKDIGKLDEITRNAKRLGYDDKNIHLVWVINSVDVAMKQNRERDRVVPEEILMSTHRGVSQTMQDLLKGNVNLSKYLDGDIWFAFNKAGVDVNIEKSKDGGSYIIDADYVQVKRKGKPVITYDQLSDSIIRKIREYTPKTTNW